MMKKKKKEKTCYTNDFYPLSSSVIQIIGNHWEIFSFWLKCLSVTDILPITTGHKQVATTT